MRNSRSPQAGLSLIEIMVALVIGLILTAGIIQLFVGSKRTYTFQEALSRIQENGRFAIDTLNHDIRMAGNLGCSSSLRREADGGTSYLASGRFRVALNNPEWYMSTFERGLQGYHWDVTASALTPVLPDGTDGAVATGVTPLNESDVLTVRGAQFSPFTVLSHPTGDPPLGSANVVIPGGSGLREGDIVLVGNCTGATIFQIYDSGTMDPSTGELAHETGSTPPPGNATQNLGMGFEGAHVMKVATRTYYLDTGQGGGPALFRRENVSNAVELVEGVERMQFRYGVDIDNDNIPDRHPTTDEEYWTGEEVLNDAPDDWENVVSVRASLLLQSISDNVTDGPVSIDFEGDTINDGVGADRRLRQVFTTKIALRNRLP